MLLKQLLVLLFVVCALCVLAECQEDDIDRHDVHRIILKPEKSKKHKKRTKSSKSKPFRPHQQINSLSSSGYDDNLFEPTAHASSTRFNHKNRQRLNYPTHHDEYRDLIKPKPPRHEESSVFNYPEEDSHYQEATGAGSSNHPSYVPYLQNSDWSPIPATQLTQDYGHYNHHGQMGDATAASSNVVNSTKKNNRKKKQRRKPIQFTTTTPFTTTTFTTTPTTTLRPLVHHTNFFTPQTHIPQTHVPQFHLPQIRVPQTHVAHTQPAKYIKPKNPQQHHYVNYNHNNKSHIKYEVSGTSTRPRFQQVAQSIQQPAYQTIHLPQETKTSTSNLGTSYEVFERAKDYNKVIKQTNGFRSSSLVPQPVYPKLYPYLPTVSTYTFMQKQPKQLDFGQRQWGFSNFTKLMV